MRGQLWLILLAALIVCWGPLNPGLRAASDRDQHGFHCLLTERGKRILAEVTFRVNKKETELHYVLKVQNLKDITMVHLHLGEMSEVNTAVLWLYPPGPPPKRIPGEFSGVLAERTVSVKDLVGPLRGHPLSDLIREMRAGHVYVNIHTKEHPAGSICGTVRLEEQGSQ